MKMFFYFILTLYLPLSPSCLVLLYVVSRAVADLGGDGKEKTLEFPISAEKSLSILVKTFFFFGDHLILGEKNA